MILCSIKNARLIVKVLFLPIVIFTKCTFCLRFYTHCCNYDRRSGHELDDSYFRQLWLEKLSYTIQPILTAVADEAVEVHCFQLTIAKVSLPP